MPSGVIIKGVGGIYTVKYNSENYFCKARGVFRKNSITPLPGDYIDFDIVSDSTREGVITNIKERKNQLIRPSVVNIDQLALFVAVKSPEADLYLVDKMLLAAFINDIVPIICINKIDLDASNFSNYLRGVYNKAGIRVINLSAINNVGINDLRECLKNKITVFAGQSGAGKSTTLNMLFGEDVMQTGDVSIKTERGKHTTRHAELFEIDGSYILDSPGFSSYEIDNIEPKDLPKLYPEFQELAGNCRFKECLHIKEPCCAVKEAVENGIIDKGRYGRYTEFAEILNVRKINKYKGK